MFFPLQVNEQPSSGRFGPFDHAREMMATGRHTKVVQERGPVAAEMAEGEDALRAVQETVSPSAVKTSFVLCLSRLMFYVYSLLIMF